MEERKNLCAQIPIRLHTRVRQEQQESGKSLSDYITDILTEYYEGGHNTMATTRTLQALASCQVQSRHLKVYVKIGLLERGNVSGSNCEQRCICCLR